MIIFPILIPLFALIFMGLRQKNHHENQNHSIVFVLMCLNTIVAFLIAFGIIDSSKALVFDWISMIDLTISFGVYWLPIPAYISAIVNLVFLSVLLFSKQDVLIQNNEKRTLSFLCGILLFLEIMLASPHVGQIIFGWQGIVFSAFALLGGVSVTAKQEKNMSAIFLLAINLVGVVLFMVAVQMGNILSSVDSGQVADFQISLWGFIFNLMDLIVVMFVLAVSVPMGILPFNSWLDRVFERSSTMAGFIFGVFLIVGSYALFHVLLVMDISQSVRITIVVYAILNMIISSMVALSHYNIGKSISYIYSAISSTVLFAFAIGSMEYALLFAVVQFIGVVGLSLTAGAIVSALSGETNMTKMGGLAQRLPGIYFMFFIIILSLGSIPPFSGFFARMWILENLNIDSITVFWALFGALMIGQLALSIVFGRIWAMVFYGTGHVDDIVSAHMDKSNGSTLISLGSLSVLALIVGWLAQYVFFVGHVDDAEATGIESVVKVFVPLMVTFIGMIVGFRKVVLNQTILPSLYKNDSVWVNNLYIKEGLLSLILIPLYFIGKGIEMIERPAIGTLVSSAIENTARRITLTIDAIFRFPVIISVLLSLVMISIMVAIFIFKMGGR